MTDIDPVDYAEATERIEIAGDEALVHHARMDSIEMDELAEIIYDAKQEFDRDTITPSDAEQDMLAKTPQIGVEVHDLTSTEFTAQFYEGDTLPTDVEIALYDVYSQFSYDPADWPHDDTVAEDPSDADVIAAYLSLVNAAWCINRVETGLQEREGGDSTIYSEDYFNTKVTQGLCLAFRDAHITYTPKPSLQGMWFREREEATRDAIDNALGITLTDAELHGLLLADWNQDVCLQSASDYGKQRSVEEGMTALKSLVQSN